MKIRPKAPAPMSGPICRDDFETWTAYQAALADSGEPDDFERLLDLPETLEDWIDQEETTVRRWFAAQPYADGPSLAAYLDGARERARHNYESMKGTP